MVLTSHTQCGIITDMSTRKIVLIVLDGWGVAPPSQYNAIARAKTPFYDSLVSYFTSTTLQASGIGVGLSHKEVGNSEVGHMNMGAGRIVQQFLPRIVSDLRSGDFYKNEALLKAIQHAKTNNSRVHIVGLFSSGSTHGSIECVNGVIDTVKQQGVKEAIIHVFTDGKDAYGKESIKTIQNILVPRIQSFTYRRPGTITGRMYGMDRNNNWPLTQEAYKTLCGKSANTTQNPAQYLKEQYAKGETDNTIKPCIVQQSNVNIPPIQDNDAVIFTNFREDSMRQMSSSFIAPKTQFKAFKQNPLKNVCIVTMTRYDPKFKALVAYPPPEINQPLAAVLSSAGKTQLHVAETEKYAHITYFFNGEKERQLPGEDRLLVRSTGGPHYENNPKMQTQRIVSEITNRMSGYDFILVNIANADILGHTGKMQAVIEGVQEIDAQLSLLIKKAHTLKFTTIITADHGNAETMINPATGNIMTSHTDNPVPFILIDDTFSKPGLPELRTIQPKGVLGDVAPTILDLMGIKKPPEMTGSSLISIL